jgi:hypothetical protein
MSFYNAILIKMLYRVSFIDPAFRPNEGCYIEGGSLGPDILWDQTTNDVWMTDTIVHYASYEDVSYGTEFDSLLKSVDGKRLLDIPQDTWDRMLATASLVPKASRALEEDDDVGTQIAVALKEKDVVYYSDGANTANAEITDTRVEVDGSMSYAIEVPVSATPLRSIMRWVSSWTGPGTVGREVWFPADDIQAGPDGTWYVKGYMSPDWLGLADGATVTLAAIIAGAQLAGVETGLGAIIMGIGNLMPQFSISIYDGRGKRYYDLFTWMKNKIMGSRVTADALEGGWKKFGVYDLGGGIGLISADAAGTIVSQTQAMTTAVLLAACSNFVTFLYGNGSTYYNAATNYWYDTAQEVPAGLQAVLIWGGESVGRTVGAITAGVGKEDPELRQAIGSAFRGGTATVIGVVAVMVGLSVYNYLPKKRAKRRRAKAQSTK